jgi:hypothetical protein
MGSKLSQIFSSARPLYFPITNKIESLCFLTIACAENFSSKLLYF